MASSRQGSTFEASSKPVPAPAAPTVVPSMPTALAPRPCVRPNL